ncbi:hypothetical protein B0H34DRAFT_832684 [Crassisporium funariophilum]|nr:hypothetical protein B0H34DRAFT_832684 [Crassisporium funariophilum]
MAYNPYPSQTLPELIVTDSSAVIIFSARTSADDLICPLSPTSSLRGVYVRSRPTSMISNSDHEGFDYGGFSQATIDRLVREEGPRALRDGAHHFNRPISPLALELESWEMDDPLMSGPSTGSSSESEDYLFMGRSVPSSTTSASSINDEEATDTVYMRERQAKRSLETVARVRALNESHARGRSVSDTKTIAPSIRTNASKLTVTPLRALLGRSDKKSQKDTMSGAGSVTIVAHGQAVVDSAEAYAEDTGAQKKPRRLSLKYRNVTKKVYNAFHRKTNSAPGAIEHFTDAGTILDIGGVSFIASTPSILNNASQDSNDVKPVETNKSSAASLFTMKRRGTLESQKTSKPSISRALSIRSRKESSAATTSAAPTVKKSQVKKLTSTKLAVEHRASIRRSVSFSGFTDVWTGMGTIEDANESEDGLDEATAEAGNLAWRLGREQRFFEPLKGTPEQEARWAAAALNATAK